MKNKYEFLARTITLDDNTDILFVGKYGRAAYTRIKEDVSLSSVFMQEISETYGSYMLDGDK